MCSMMSLHQGVRAIGVHSAMPLRHANASHLHDALLPLRSMRSVLAVHARPRLAHRPLGPVGAASGEAPTPHVDGRKVVETRRTDMPETPNTTMVASVTREPLLPMIPGQRESGSLTRFAVMPGMVETMVDVRMDAAGRADRQREGGGAPSERRPARILRWRSLLQRVAAWRVRKTPLEVAPGKEVVF
jgi:hypothetical protein